MIFAPEIGALLDYHGHPMRVIEVYENGTVRIQSMLSPMIVKIVKTNELGILGMKSKED